MLRVKVPLAANCYGELLTTDRLAFETKVRDERQGT